MTDILLIIFSVIFIFFLYRFVIVFRNARLAMKEEKAKQNIDLIEKLDAELESNSDTKEQP